MMTKTRPIRSVHLQNRSIHDIPTQKCFQNGILIRLFHRSDWGIIPLTMRNELFLDFLLLTTVEEIP
jgi:hypothetical protein